MDGPNPGKSSGHRPKKHNMMKDAYCWKCHTSANVNYDYHCKSCGRSFHYQNCSRPSASNSIRSFDLSHLQLGLDKSSCPVCQNMLEEAFRYEEDERAELNHAISITIKKLKDFDATKSFYNPVDQLAHLNYTSLIAHPMDLAFLEQRAEKASFTSAQEFLYELQLIWHNSFIYNRPQSALTKIAKEMCNLAFDECVKISFCYQCYIKSSSNDKLHQSDEFLVSCNRPHGIVWAKKEVCEESAPYLPAKVINFTRGARLSTVDVCFFGTREMITGLNINECFLFSKNAPKFVPQENSTVNTVALDEPIMADLEKYLEAVNVMYDAHSNSAKPQRFGKLKVYAPDNTLLKMRKLYLMKLKGEPSYRPLVIERPAPIKIPSPEPTPTLTTARPSPVNQLISSVKHSSLPFNPSAFQSNASPSNEHKSKKVKIQSHSQVRTSTSTSINATPKVGRLQPNPAGISTAAVALGTTNKPTPTFSFNTGTSPIPKAIQREHSRQATGTAQSVPTMMSSNVATLAGTSNSGTAQAHVQPLTANDQSSLNKLSQHLFQWGKIIEQKDAEYEAIKMKNIEAEEKLHNEMEQLKKVVDEKDKLLADVTRAVDEREAYKKILKSKSPLYCRGCLCPDRVRLSACCPSVYYCSKKCQIADWPRHGRHCKRKTQKGDKPVIKTEIED